MQPQFKDRDQFTHEGKLKMEELLDYSLFFVKDSFCTDADIANLVAEWALPGDHYDPALRRFEKSGLTLEPFVDLVSYLRTHDNQRLNVDDQALNLTWI